jgi:hypothetical protein
MNSKRKEPPTVVTAVRLSPELRRRAKALAAQPDSGCDGSVTALIRRLLIKEITNHPTA